MKDTLNMKGRFLIRALDAKTGALLREWRMENLLTSISQTIRTQMLLGTYAGAGDELAIKYFAFGTGSGTPTASDTQLFEEVYRKQVTQLSSPSAGVVQSVCSLGSLEANYHLTEIGVFCGPEASSLPDSGVMLSHIAWDFEKNTNIVLNIVRTDSCTLN